MTDLQKVAEAYACSAVDIEHLQRFKGTLAYELLNTGFLAGAAYRDAEVNKLRGALKFYADTGSWGCDKTAHKDEIIDSEDMEPSPDGLGTVGGKTARKALESDS